MEGKLAVNKFLKLFSIKADLKKKKKKMKMHCCKH